MRNLALLALVILVTLSGCQFAAVKTDVGRDYNAWTLDNLIMWVCIGILAGVLYAMLKDPPDDD